MNLIYQIHSYGILVSYSCGIKKHIRQFWAPTTSCTTSSKCPTLLKQLWNQLNCHCAECLYFIFFFLIKQEDDKDYKKKMQMKEDFGVFVTMAVIVFLVSQNQNLAWCSSTVVDHLSPVACIIKLLRSS